MQDDQFLQRISGKIQRLTGCHVDLEIDREEVGTLHVELDREVPLMVMGANIYQYAGFARMCIEYATASIRERRSIDTGISLDNSPELATCLCQPLLELLVTNGCYAQWSNPPASASN